MDNTCQLSYKTKLNNRTLWFDGTSEYDANDILLLMKKGVIVNWVDKITPDIANYNKLGSTPIRVKQQCESLDVSWNLPAPYDKLDPIEYIMDRHASMYEQAPQHEQDQREIRLAQELTKYIDMGLIDVLRATIYIINTLVASNTIWGIGRGSSVSSYVLYIIGVHDVDSFAYQLDIDDFLH